VPILEVILEAKVTEYAYQKKCFSLKLNVIGRVGWPDRIYLYYGARIIFIEFKRVGQKPRRIQDYIHGKLREYGFRVYVVDDFSQGVAAIDDLTKDSPHV
jgi:hypothetical protein